MTDVTATLVSHDIAYGRRVRARRAARTAAGVIGRPVLRSLAVSRRSRRIAFALSPLYRSRLATFRRAVRRDRREERTYAHFATHLVAPNLRKRAGRRFDVRYDPDVTR